MLAAVPLDVGADFIRAYRARDRGAEAVQVLYRRLRRRASKGANPCAGRGCRAGAT
ncbi:protein of unknown function [Methylorubrum extorquens]|uniref:Uncharacterized protein n=1 Tax=Methylorubrum extorquens TaxID=408 RepID=A0A2N9ATE2_METEX|nr:protein of unknown function [Methylorubrum extorquens]